MRKIILILFVILNGFCVNESILDNIPKFQTREEAMHWVYDNIEYDNNKLQNSLETGINIGYTPEKTYYLRSGVCGDQAILLMRILKDQFNDESILLRVWIEGVNDPLGHAIILNNGTTYDTTADESPVKSYRYTIIDSYNYNFVMTFLAIDDLIN